MDLVLTARDADRLRGQGVDLSLKRNGKGQTVRQQAEAMAASGYSVYRSYDEQDGILDELYAIAKRNPAIVKLKVIGPTPWSIYTGFGIEGISTPAARNQVIGRAVSYLLR